MVGKASYTAGTRSGAEISLEDGEFERDIAELDDDDLAEFNIDDDDDDSFSNGNPDLEAYPGTRGSRHAFLGEPEDLSTKFRRFKRNLRQMTISNNSKKLVIGVGLFIVVCTFFSIMFFLGDGSDDMIPGGAIHGGNDHLDNDKSDEKTGPPDSTDDSQPPIQNLEKMSLDDMRQGSYYVFDYQLNFINYDDASESPESSATKRDHDDDHDDHDDDDHDDDHDNDHDDHDHDDDDDEHDEKKGDKNKQQDAPTKAALGPNDDRGFYLHQVGTTVWLRQAADPDFNRNIIDLSSLTYDGVALNPTLVSVSKGLDKLVVFSEKTSQWRHSSYAKYWLVDVETLKVEPVYYLTEKKDGEESILPVHISYAAFTPDNNYVYFHYMGNLMLREVKSGKISKITKDGDTKNIFYGKPDWVYEEEVLGTDRAVYWTDDGAKMAYIRWDETNVPTYYLEIFGDKEYPEVVDLKYPKPGFTNPKVALYVYNVSKGKSIKVKQPEEENKDAESLGDDFIIYQTVWLNDDELLFKRTDRTSRKIQVCVYDMKTGKTNIVRSTNADSYNGWYKNNGQIYVLPDNKGYIDVVVSEQHDHLAHFKTATESEGDLLTSGDWDVIGGVVGYDKSTDSVYFVGTSGNALQRQIYKVGLEDSTLVGLTALDQTNAYSLKMSKGGRYGLMKYAGPELPQQKIVEVSQLASTPGYFDSLPNLNNAGDVDALFEHLEVPHKEYTQIKLHDDVYVNVVEVKPANFDESKKYPVLVSVYGGPGIQKVSADFSYGFEEVVSSSMEVIVLYIDPRGTGGLGWDYRSYARNNIGFYEPRDITEATERYIEEHGYVNADKVAVWGWSYGGFTTLKTLEFDEGQVFKYGMAVAPVTDWHLYDSIYTERYMGDPTVKDLKSYKDSKIANIDAFKSINRFLIMHGTGDDNVHYQNTLKLLNQFDIHSVENYDVHVFTDSDHSITHDNANTIVYDKLYNWLGEAFFS